MICTGTWVEETNRSILEEAAHAAFPEMKRIIWIVVLGQRIRLMLIIMHYALLIMHYYYASAKISLYNEEFDPGSG